MALSPQLLLHHEALDRQHAGLFDLLDAAAAALDGGDGPRLERAVSAFADAMLEHVAQEEAIMEEWRYPERGRHRVAHEVFLADLQQLRATLQAAGPTALVGEWLRVRLPEWLRFHIAVNDVPIGAYLARRGSPRPGARRSAARQAS